MAMVYDRITINLASRGLTPIVEVTQNNDGRGMIVTVADTDISAFTARIYIAKPSGNKVYNACTISNGQVTVEFTKQSLAEYGTAKMVMQFIQNQRVVTSYPMILKIIEDDTIDAVESSNEFSVLEELISQVAPAVQAANTATTAANNAADNANSKATAANNAANNANEKAALAATNARIAGEQSNAAHIAANNAQQQADRASAAATGANNAADRANEAAAQIENSIRNIITAYPTADYTTGETMSYGNNSLYRGVPLNSSRQIGEGFFLDTGASSTGSSTSYYGRIRITKPGNHNALVSGRVVCDCANVTSDRHFFIGRKQTNSNAIGYIATGYISNIQLEAGKDTNRAISFPPVLISVQEGDVISLVFVNTTSTNVDDKFLGNYGNIGANKTYVTVELLN